MTKHIRLQSVLRDWLDKPLAHLPEALAERVKRDFFPNEWDSLTPAQRLSIARQCDALNDPARQTENLYWWNFAVRIDELGKHIAKWESKSAPTISELAQQETKLLELRAQLAAMKAQFERGTYPPTQCADSTATEGERLDQSAGSGHLAAFRGMENLKPHEVTISFVGDKSPEGLSASNLLEISARGVRRRTSLAEFGLADRRNGALNSQATILLGMAADKSLKLAGGSISAAMSRLRKAIRNNLGITSDPFSPHHPRSGWEPLFSISDKRGLADTRAREDAERKTMSLEACQEQGIQFPPRSIEHDFDDEDDDASRWLKTMKGGSSN